MVYYLIPSLSLAPKVVLKVVTSYPSTYLSVTVIYMYLFCSPSLSLSLSLCPSHSYTHTLSLSLSLAICSEQFSVQYHVYQVFKYHYTFPYTQQDSIYPWQGKSSFYTNFAEPLGSCLMMTCRLACFSVLAIIRKILDLDIHNRCQVIHGIFGFARLSSIC